MEYNVSKQDQNSLVYTRISYQSINIQTPISLSSPTSVYNYTTISKLTNAENRAVTQKVDLVINHLTTDYINSFRSNIVDDSMVKNGTVAYWFNQIAQENIYGTSNAHIYSDRKSYHYTEHLEKSWFSIEKLIPNHILTGWNNINVKHCVEVEVSPGQTYLGRMDVQLAKVNVPYNAVLYLQAQDYKEDFLVDSHITDLASKIFGNNAVISQVDQITAQAVISGVINHEVLQNVYVTIE